MRIKTHSQTKQKARRRGDLQSPSALRQPENSRKAGRLKVSPTEYLTGYSPGLNRVQSPCFTRCILILSFLLSSFIEAAEEKIFLCRKTDDTIRLDGKATEPSWETAKIISPFLIAGSKDKKAANSLTSAKLLWDDKFLYFFGEMEDGDLQALNKEKDGEIWKDDVFELFFKPDKDGAGYYEFEVNALGTILDMYIPERHPDLYIRHKSDRKFAISAKVEVDGTLNQSDDADRGWTVEGRIPWTDFAPTGGAPATNATWRFNLCRYDYSAKIDKSPELTVSTPEMPRDFHAHEFFAPLQFTGVWDPREALPEQVRKIRGFGGSKIVGTPEPPLPYLAAEAYPEHRITNLITFQFEPGRKRLIYIDQPPGSKTSRVMRYDPNAKTETVLLESPDVIYDVAFHPKWETNHQFLTSQWGPSENDRFNREVTVRRWLYDPDSPDSIDPEGGVTVFDWHSEGHTGGALAFDDKGLLYITTGDGTSDSDTNLTGQDLSVIQAKVLRIDIDSPDEGKTYSIPKDNPFLGRENTKPETFAYGMRNPWRSDWDTKLGRLWVGNNGQDRLEQAYLIAPGGNYGWSVTEGSGVFYSERKRGPDPILLPTAEHDHGESRSLTGGVVYRGEKYPDLQDCYLYGDHTTGKIWAVLHDGTKVVKNWEIADTTLKITEFGVDPATGDILISSHEGLPGGGLYKLIPNPSRNQTSQFPRSLNDTGLFQSVKGHVVHDSLLPYSVIIPEWVDGADIDRYLLLPEEEPYIGFGARRGWNFPNGTVALQSISLGEGKERRYVETRILTKQQDEWAAYSYAWNSDQTGADLVEAAGREIDLGNRKWKVPSRSECMVCHSRAANFILGLSTSQMNRDHNYGQEFVANQLQVIDDLGFFLRKGAQKRTSLLKPPPGEQPRFTDPFDTLADLNLRARSYLHASCAHCHIEAGGGNAMMNLTDFADDEKFNVVNIVPNHGSLGLGSEARIVFPGDPAQSVMFHRCSRVGPEKMPPFGSSTPDQRATALLIDWIASLKKSSE